MKVFEDAGLLLRRQPAAGDDPRARRAVHARGLQGRARGGRLRRARRRRTSRRCARCSTTSTRLGVRHRVLFLDADDETLLTRYKETRRRHPLAPTASVARGHRRRARAARAAARARRPRHRLDRPQGARRCGARSPTSCCRARRAHAAGGDVQSLRLQARPAARRRPRLRRALPAQPALRARAARRSPATTSGSSTTSPARAASTSSTSA